MTTSKRNASAPNYHIAGARTGRKTTASIPREAKPWLLLLAFLLLMCAVIWGVMVPMSEAALADARMSCAMAGGCIHA